LFLDPSWSCSVPALAEAREMEQHWRTGAKVSLDDESMNTEQLTFPEGSPLVTAKELREYL